MRSSCLVLQRTVVAAGLSAIAVAASGCSGDSHAEAESPPATTSGHVNAQPPAQSSVDLSKFRAAFKEAYGERPWHRQITAMEIETDTERHRVLNVTLKLERVPDTVVAEICEAGFAVASELRMGIDVVGVINSAGGDGGCA